MAPKPLIDPVPSRYPLRFSALGKTSTSNQGVAGWRTNYHRPDIQLAPAIVIDLTTPINQAHSSHVVINNPLVPHGVQMSKYEQVVSGATTYLKRISARRTTKTVTADDVQTYLDAQGYKRAPSERVRVINTVFSSGTFEAGNFVRSSREAARSRMIREWRVRS